VLKSRYHGPIIALVVVRVHLRPGQSEWKHSITGGPLSFPGGAALLLIFDSNSVALGFIRMTTCLGVCGLNHKTA
jgi:hypothetical protein